MPSTVAHTPGPWKQRSIPGHLFELQDADGNPILKLRGGMMPALTDARLIAAAPELADALREFAVWLVSPDLSRETITEMHNLATRTLARIDGDTL